MAAGAARQRLLDAATDHVAQNGLTDLSLRQLADELGTSHRMLIHHFGSKAGLWVAIIREVERRQIELLPDLRPDPTASFETAMRRWWHHISDPALWPNERLFFEVYAQGLRGRPPTSEMLDGIVDTWVEPVAALAVEAGLPNADATSFARLSVAVTRGLLLDLLATGDREGVDSAFEYFVRVTAPSFAR